MWACRPTRLGGGAAGIAALLGRIFNPPLQTHLPPLLTVGAHFICARTAPRNHQGPRSSRPGHGGMWACRPTRLGGGAAGIAALLGRIFNPPLQTHLPPPLTVGAHFICARTAPRNHQGPRSSRPGHGGMWACRPTRLGGGAAGIAALLGRIFNPPLQTHLPPPLTVGAHFICARTAPRNHRGPRSSRPGHGGMWACRPTRLGGGAAGIAALLGRIFNPPLQTHLPPLLTVGAHFICARTAPRNRQGPRSSRPGHGGMWACRPTRLGGGAAGIAALLGRIFNPPLQTHLPPLLTVGAHFICARTAPGV